MSDTIYKIIPESYSFFPTDTKTIDGAVKLLKMYVQADNISWESFESPAFVSNGLWFCQICNRSFESYGTALQA